MLPNGNSMTSTHTKILNIPSLPISARTQHMFPEMNTTGLLSIGQLCDHDCTAIFSRTRLIIRNKENEIILIGRRDPYITNGMWIVNLDDNAPKQNMLNTCNAIILSDTTKKDLAQFHHASLGFPVKSTVIQAIDAGFLSSFPGMNKKLITKHLPKSMTTYRGHLDQERKNLQSTKTPQTLSSPHDIPPPSPAIRTNIHISAIVSATDITYTDKIYSDLTGKFPVQSTLGNKYVLIVYNYDANAIIAEPLKDRTAGEIARGHQVVYTYLKDRGLSPKFEVLDNECSAELVAVMRKNKIKFQLVPPHLHRANAAERAIRTWKNHFITILCGLDPQFPLQLWDRLIDQTNLTLNLLRPSRLNPKMAAEAMLNGPFDFNRTPIAPLGTKVLVHEKPTVRGTWSPHAIDGWYVGPARQHYRCYKIYVPSTKGIRHSETVEFFPYQVTMPATSSADLAIETAKDLTHILRNPAPATPFEHYGTETSIALAKLADIFNQLKPIQTPRQQTKPPITPKTTLDFSSLLPPNPPPRRLIDFSSILPPLPRVSPATLRPAPTPRVPPSTSVVRPTHRPSPAITPNTYTGQRQRGCDGIHIPTQHRYPTRLSQQQTALVNLVTPSTAPPMTSSRYATAANIMMLQSLPQLPHHAINSVLDPTTGNTLEYRDLVKGPTATQWQKSFANELGRLTNGVGQRMPTGTNTMAFIPRHLVRKGKTVTYGNLVCDIKPNKTETHRSRLTVGGNLIAFPGDKSTATADLTTIKILLNSTISTKRARFSTADIKNFYLGTPLVEFEYMKLRLAIIPDEIIKQYNLRDIEVDGWVYCEIRKGMYGLPHAGKIANERLVRHLAPYGYSPSPSTPGLWTHHTRPIVFTLVVDDFGIKSINQSDVDHLLNALRKQYEITVDTTGALYCGLTLAWNYDKRYVDVSMPGYVHKALQRFHHPPPSKPQHSPHRWEEPTYGAKIQYAPIDPNLPLLSPCDLTRVQQVVGTFLYYARAIDNTMLVALNSIAGDQSTATANTTKAVNHLLDYAATHPEASVRYHASGMRLHIDSDASYLSIKHARSRAGGHFMLSDSTTDTSKTPINPMPNGTLHAECRTLRNVMASAAEAELGALFHNAQVAEPMRTCLAEIGHPQPRTPLKTDNSTAAGIVTSSIRQKKSKAMDMRFFWVKDRVSQKHFLVYWESGRTNRGDYFTKHFPPRHHVDVRPTYLHIDT